MAGTWQPYWRANTAYLTAAVVSPTGTFGGFTWRCTTPGTSGGTEPVWPDPLISPTVSDAGVTWTVGTGLVQAFQAGFVTAMTSFSTANPTIVRQVRTVRARSGTTVDKPYYFIGDITDVINTSQGVRNRTMSIDSWLVDQMGEQAESNDRMNFARDVITDWITQNFHMAGGRSLVQNVGTQDSEFDENGTIFPAVLFQITAMILEGRS